MQGFYAHEGSGGGGGGGGGGGFAETAGGNLMMQMGMDYGQRWYRDSSGFLAKVLPVADLKKRFRVSHRYVVVKLGMLAMPFRDKYQRMSASSDGGGFGGGFGEAAGGGDGSACEFYPPIDDPCAPDLYIPTMAVLTYVVLTAVIQGLELGELSPATMAATASFAFLLVFGEALAVKLYRSAVPGLPPVSIFDLVAVFGYLFVPVSAATALRMLCESVLGTESVLSPVLFVLPFALAASFAFFAFKTVGELLSSHGNLPPRAKPGALGFAALQLLCFWWAYTRPFGAARAAA